MGLFLALLSSVFATAKDLMSKRLAQQIDGMTSTFASFAFALPFYLVVLTVLWLGGWERLEYSWYFLLLVFLRSVTDTFAEGLKMYAFAHGDISVVAAFFSLSPLFLLLVSPWITGDQPSWLGGLAVVLVVAGSLLMVYRPSQQAAPSQKKGILLALTASGFFALNSCFDRLAVIEGTPVFAGFAMTLCSAVFLTPLIATRPERRQAVRNYWGEFATRGFLETCFMIAKLSALLWMQAPYVVSVQRFSLILSILGGRFLFKEQNFGRRLAAGALILTGIILIILAQAGLPFEKIADGH